MNEAKHTGALVVRGLSVVRDGRALLTNADATFARGQVHAVVGRSGAGKSVLMKAATGLLEASAGIVTLDDVTARAGDARAFAALRARVVFVHQDPALLDDLTVEENVAFARARTAVGGDVAGDVSRVLSSLGLVDVARRLPREISPGQQRTAAFARALVLTPDFLVVDEPTTGIDPSGARAVYRALAEVFARGTTLVVVTHDRRLLAALTPRLVTVHEGRVAFEGSLDDARRLRPPPLDALLFDDDARTAARPLESP